MASATIRKVSNIFIPGSSYDYFIIPSRITYSNASISHSSGWNEFTTGGPITVWDGINNQYFTYDHAWGTIVTAGSSSRWSPNLANLTFVFSNAAYKPASGGGGEFYHLKVEILDAAGYSGDTSADRKIVLASLADDTSTNVKGFWIQSYLEYIAGNSEFAAAGAGTVRMSIVNGLGVEQPGTFFFPFTDIDVRYDAITGDPNTPGQPYSESIEITKNCTDIYATTTSWLHLTSGTGGTDIDVVNVTSGTSYAYNDDPANRMGLLFANARNSNDESSDGAPTGIVGKFSTGGKVVWRGSVCGTSLRGEGLLYEIKYFTNPSSFIQTATNMPDPNPQYKVKGSNTNISSKVPVPSPGESHPSAGTTITATFNGWNTTASGGGVAYQPGAVYSTDANLSLYAQWKFTYSYAITFVMNGGYGIKGDSIIDSSIVFNVVSGGSINVVNQGWRFERLGYTIAGWSTSASGTAQYATNYTFTNVTGPATYYAVWVKKTHNVNFYDGYSNTLIKTVPVAHGSDVPQDQIPVSDQTYSGKVFKKPGFYTFQGWTGSLTNILDDENVIAIWEFIPIWVMKSGQWVKYHPTESGTTPSSYSITSVPFHGPQTAAYASVPHSNSPELTMNIRLNNFYHNADGSVRFDVDMASLEAGSYAYPFDIFAWIVVGNNITNYAANAYSKTNILSKPADITSWADNQIKLGSPVTLSAPNPNNLQVHFVVGLMAICTCTANATTNTPVIAKNVTTFVPRIEPYFWRMQYDKDPSVSTGTLGWHLARPFYICKTINGVKGWCSCEDETTLVYDANGNKLN